MSIITVGIDLAKSVFAVQGVDDNGQATLVKPKVTRDQLLALIAQLPPCLIGMEACSGAHHWARQFRQYGHTVKLMAPKFVTPYRMSGKRGKNDAADAAAICEAVTRPNMRFVPVKEEHQQIILCLHRTRQGFVEQRTATSSVSAAYSPTNEGNTSVLDQVQERFDGVKGSNPSTYILLCLLSAFLREKTMRLRSLSPHGD